MKKSDHPNPLIPLQPSNAPSLPPRKSRITISPLPLQPNLPPKPFPNTSKARTDPHYPPRPLTQKPKSSRISQNSCQLSNFSPSQIKSSIQDNGSVKGYAATTDQGLIRDYNEDRVSIILNINKPRDRSEEIWPKSSFFAVYDGHGGSACADFLRDNLHQFVTRSVFFPSDPKEALIEGFAKAENTFLEYAKGLQPIDTSGSCAIVVLIVADMCYVANLGDSRAVMCAEGGKKVYPLSKDHKPADFDEKNRIEKCGGRVYQSSYMVGEENVQGPDRVLPGRLSVSRSFGDIEAKLVEYGGIPGVLSCEPDVKDFKIGEDFDFIVLASDGIFDKVSSREAVLSVVDRINQRFVGDIHRMCSIGVESIMMTALEKRTNDNITVVMIALEGLFQKLQDLSKSQRTMSH